MNRPPKGKADYFSLGEYNVACAQCGRKFKSGVMRKHWQGYLVCPAHWEPRHPQDFVKAPREDTGLGGGLAQPPGDTFVTVTPAIPPEVPPPPPDIPDPPAPAPDPGPPAPPPPPSAENGPVWTQRVAAASKRWSAVTYGDSKFVAGGLDTGTLGPCAMYSTDNGVSWINSDAMSGGGGYGFAFDGLRHGNGTFLGIVSPADTRRSSDGISWSNGGSFSGTPNGLFFAADAGHFVMIIVNQNYCNVSTDGGTYSSQTLPSVNTWSCGAENSDAGVRIIAANQATAVSADGSTWAAGGNMPWSGGTRSMACGNGVFVATAQGLETRVAYSADNGVTWSFSAALSGSTQTYRVIFADGYFYAFNIGGQLVSNSLDGNSWNSLTELLPAALSSFTLDIAADNALHYAAVGNAGANTSIVASGVVS